MRKTRTSQIESAIADIMSIVDGHNGIDSDSIMDMMVSKGHDGIVVNDTINIMEETGAMIWVSGQWYLNNDNETKKENVMKIETIIENLKSGKKEETLKKAKADALSLGFTDTANIRTKKDFIEYLETCKTPDTDNGTIVTTAGIDTDEVKETEKTKSPETTKKTRLQEKNDNRIAALQSCLDSLYVVLSGFDNNTLKQSKTSVSSILNTVSREYLDDGIIFKITSLNKHNIKKEYKLHLETELIPEIHRALDEEHDLQDKEPEKVIVTIDDKVRMLKPDTAMILEQHDMKEKSRFDTLFNMMQEQDKKIKELTKLVSCHKDTINILLKRIETGNHTNVSTTSETSVKSTKKTVKPEKTPEQIQAENRAAYIKGLTGIDKAVFSIMSNDDTEIKSILIHDSLEDFSPKMVKKSLAKFVTIGLIDCKKYKDTKKYAIASVSSFKEKTETGKKADKATKTVSKKTENKTFSRGKSSDKFTRKQAIQQAIEETMKSEKSFTMKDILLRQDDIFVKAGGNSNPKATNATTAALKALLAEGSLAKDGRKYIVK
jgi:hypothetical protein